MIKELQGITGRLAHQALDAYYLRHQVLANNIANIDSEGFQAKRLNFEEQLSGLKNAVLSGASDKEILSQLDQVHPFIEEKPASGPLADPSLRLDEEITQVAQNTLQYETVLTALARRGSLMRIAVTGEP
jgi:flagellar basal-body rod protein FlgB